MYRKISGGRKTRRHHTKKAAPRRRSRRRIGAAGGDLVNIVGGLTVGGIAGRELATLLGKFFPSLAGSQILDGAIQAAVGYFLPKMVKGQFVQFIGYGMIASGGQTIAVGTGMINGPGNVQAYRINGTPNLRVVNGPAIAGTANLKVIGDIGQNRIQNPPAAVGVGNNVRARNFRHHG